MVFNQHLRCPSERGMNVHNCRLISARFLLTTPNIIRRPCRKKQHQFCLSLSKIYYLNLCQKKHIEYIWISNFEAVGGMHPNLFHDVSGGFLGNVYPIRDSRLAPAHVLLFAKTPNINKWNPFKRFNFRPRIYILCFQGVRPLRLGGKKPSWTSFTSKGYDLLGWGGETFMDILYFQ